LHPILKLKSAQRRLFAPTQIERQPLSARSAHVSFIIIFFFKITPRYFCNLFIINDLRIEQYYSAKPSLALCSLEFLLPFFMQEKNRPTLVEWISFPQLFLNFFILIFLVALNRENQRDRKSLS